MKIQLLSIGLKKLKVVNTQTKGRAFTADKAYIIGKKRMYVNWGMHA